MVRGTTTRTHEDGRARSAAVFSSCGAYRYALRRDWAAGEGGAGRLVFVMLNPSTADERRNDPTVSRCEGRARAMGFGGLEVVNLFAFRATDPRALKAAPAPEGTLNDVFLRAAARSAGMVICAWGAHGGHRGRASEVECLLRRCNLKLWHLGLTAGGFPRHPLYTRRAIRPMEWD